MLGNGTLYRVRRQRKAKRMNDVVQGIFLGWTLTLATIGITLQVAQRLRDEEQQILRDVSRLDMAEAERHLEVLDAFGSFQRALTNFVNDPLPDAEEPSVNQSDSTLDYYQKTLNDALRKVEALETELAQREQLLANWEQSDENFRKWLKPEREHRDFTPERCLG